MPLLRLKFPFLLKTIFLGRAKRSVHKQSNPILLSSSKAHTKALTYITYVEKSELILTGSSDLSVRVWSLGGRYVGTFGSPVAWSDMTDDTPLPNDYGFRIPPDIKREASFTTMQVLTGGKYTLPRFKKRVVKKVSEAEVSDEQKKKKRSCGTIKLLKKPYLGNYFKLPIDPEYQEEPEMGSDLFCVRFSSFI